MHDGVGSLTFTACLPRRLVLPRRLLLPFRPPEVRYALFSMVTIDGALPFRIGRSVRTSGPDLPLAFSYPSSRSGCLALASRPGHLLLSSLFGDGLSVDVRSPHPTSWECRRVFFRHIPLSVPSLIAIHRTSFFAFFRYSVPSCSFSATSVSLLSSMRGAPCTQVVVDLPAPCGLITRCALSASRVTFVSFPPAPPNALCARHVFFLVCCHR